MRCNKIGFMSKAEAKRAKRSCQRAREDGAVWREESRIYRCPSCGGWHLTSTPLEQHEQETA